MKKIMNRSQRIQIIKGNLEDEQKKPGAATKRVFFRGKPKPLFIISLPIDLLMYRLDNARTRRQQLRYLKNHPDLPVNLFSDPETLAAQEAQGDILLEMVLATKDFIQDLIARGQEDPAIITYDGYLVNGNRRTAALRYIGAEFVDCVVLPESFNKKEIFDLELDLQISQDFREPYHWINELIDIEQGIKDKSIDETQEEMARRLHIDAPRLQAKLRMKNLVDSYLYWAGKKGEYDYEKLDDAEQDFSELEKETRKTKYKNDPDFLDQAQKAVFIIIEEKPKEGRSYSWIRDLFRNFEQVHSRLQHKLGEGKNPTSKPTEIKEKSLLDTLAGEEKDKEKIADVFTASTPEEIKKQSILIQETIKDVKAETSEKKDAEAIYESVSDALREMQGLSIDQNTAKIGEIYNKLEELIKIASGLFAQAKKYRKGK